MHAYFIWFHKDKKKILSKTEILIKWPPMPLNWFWINESIFFSLILSFGVHFKHFTWIKIIVFKYTSHLNVQTRLHTQFICGITTNGSTTNGTACDVRFWCCRFVGFELFRVKLCLKCENSMPNCVANCFVSALSFGFSFCGNDALQLNAWNCNHVHRLHSKLFRSFSPSVYVCIK